jgi:hypothetical protein
MSQSIWVFRGVRRSRSVSMLAALLTASGLVFVAPAPASAAVPGAPTHVLAIASVHGVRVGSTPPADNGGKPITRYLITARCPG